MSTIQDNVKNMVSAMSIPTSQEVYTQVLQLVLGTPQSLDFKTLANLHRVDNLQGIWLDNSAGISPAIVTVAATSQSFSVPAGYQGVSPLYVSQDMVLNFSGNGQVTAILINFPTPVGVWPAVEGGNFTFTGGALNTQDVNIAANTEVGGIDIIPKFYTNDDGLVHARKGIVLNGAVTAAATTVILAGSPSVFVSSVDISLDATANLAAAGTLYVRLFFGTSNVTLFERVTFVPAAAPTVLTPPIQLVNAADLDFLGNLAGDDLALTVSTALIAGSLRYTIGGGTTARA